ncbi:PIR protein CIR protein [Plasmodium vinckei vinckei]|uniref:PIR protein CIR protein n=1 Tax=Plasmodium vinckei vinckei TaxID=54757 RepID=A0A449BMN9_PLAVN|nr:PIR protein CIR protein [Plasmodium vinckei vinckei]VEV54717.1 PIR protein CIR protein [Plasmodium vinckei vinckei]
MANSPYIIEDLYKDIYTTNDYFGDINDQFIVKNNYESIHNYCHSWWDSGKENCQNYIQLAICGFIYLLTNLKKYGLKNDKLVEYAILWLSYKLNEAPKECDIKLNEFYTKYIEKNDDYNKKIKGDENMIYKAIINKKKELTNISELSKFNNLFNILFLSYYEIDDESMYCDYYSYYPQAFVNKFKELNNDPKNIKYSLYSQILSTLSDDYKNLKKSYDRYNYKCGTFPDLPELNPKSPVEKSGINSEQTLGHLIDKFDSKYDKLAEYTILLLSYKLNQHSKYSSTNLNEFYTKYIETNNDYNMEINNNGPTSKEIIDKKKDLIDMNTNEISKFNVPFSILLLLYNGIKSDNLDCTKYSSSANNFASNFEELNNDSNIIGNASFRKLLSILSNDYNNLKNKYGNNDSCDFPSISQVNLPKISVGNSGDGGEQISLHTPEATSSSSSIASKLIPGLSAFAIPAFLGIAYKYSLFGIDKVFQRQYIRNKLKKIKNKMKLNI